MVAPEVVVQPVLLRSILHASLDVSPLVSCSALCASAIGKLQARCQQAPPTPHKLSTFLQFSSCTERVYTWNARIAGAASTAESSYIDDREAAMSFTPAGGPPPSDNILLATSTRMCGPAGAAPAPGHTGCSGRSGCLRARLLRRRKLRAQSGCRHSSPRLLSCAPANLSRRPGRPGRALLTRILQHYGRKKCM